MKKWLAPVLGFMPFLYGFLMTIAINLFFAGSAPVMGPVLSVLFLVLWSALAKAANYRLLNTKKVLLYMHIPGIAVIFMLALNAVLGQSFLPVWLEYLLLYYMMPTLPISYMLIFLFNNVYIIYAMSLLFMVCAAYMGCNTKRRRVK